MPLSSRQDKFVSALRKDGWRVRGILTSPASETVDGRDVAVDDPGEGLVRVVVVKANGIERRYDVSPDGRSDEVALNAAFGPHQNPALKG